MMSSDDENVVALSSSCKKRQVFGRVSAANKKLILQSHELGKDCKCARFECFKRISEPERKTIMKKTLPC